MRIPSSIVRIGLHLSMRRVELKLSTKFDLFVSHLTSGLKACFDHLDCGPSSASQTSANGFAFCNASIAFLKVNGLNAPAAFQNNWNISKPGNSFLKFLTKCLQQYLLPTFGHMSLMAGSIPFRDKQSY